MSEFREKAIRIATGLANDPPLLVDTLLALFEASATEKKRAQWRQHKRASRSTDSQRTGVYIDNNKEGSDTTNNTASTDSQRTTQAKPKKVYPDAFTVQWDALEQRTGQKFPALKAWNKGGRPEFADAWRKYLAHCKRERRYVQHVSTWLNARGWEDQYPTARASAPYDPYGGK